MVSEYPNFDWQNQAACREEDSELFFGHDGERKKDMTSRERLAKMICHNSCEVRIECLEYAMDTQEPFGVLGGMGEAERRRLSVRHMLPSKL